MDEKGAHIIAETLWGIASVALFVAGATLTYVVGALHLTPMLLIALIPIGGGFLGCVVEASHHGRTWRG